MIDTRVHDGTFRLRSVAAAMLLAMAALVSPQAARGEFNGPDGSIFPTAPLAFEPIYMRFVCNDLETCAGASVSMQGNTIFVTRYSAGCLVCGNPPSVYIEIGRLPAGTYTVQASNHGPQTITVTDPHPKGPYAMASLAFPFINYTDQWYDASSPGWGMAITQHASDGLFAIWAVQGPDNNPVWYTVQPGGWDGFNQFAGPVYRTTGPYFGASGGPGRVVSAPVGSAKLTFFDPAHGTFEFQVEGVSGTRNITRLPF